MRAGEVLGGRYELLDVIGAGGSAVVWRARDRVLSRIVAVKVLAGRHADDPVSRARVHDEARAAAALTHPNIAQIYDFGETGDDEGHRLPYVVMELVRGRTLAERMIAGPLPPQYALRTAAEVASALVAAHAADLVHRDIKPANVLVTETGAKVVDFGIATMTGPDGTAGPDEDVMGTPAYVAPERLTGGAVTPASDMYALGVLLYRLLSGHSPWDAETTTQMLTAHVHIEPDPLTPITGVPPYIVDLCNRCLDKDPTLRPTARDAAEQLAKAAGVAVVQDEVPPATGAPAAVLIPAPPARSRKRRTVAVVAAAGLLVAGLGAWWSLRPPDPDGPGTAAVPFGATTPSAAASAGAPPVPADLPSLRPAAPGPRGTTSTTSTSGPAPPAATPGTTRPTRPTGATAGPVPTPPTTTAAPPPAELTLTSAGGSVRARCPSAGTAELTSWTAAKPYKLGPVDAGPGTSATAAFRHGNRTVTMTVTCSGGVPSTSNDGP